jgi:hypothetical protein
MNPGEKVVWSRTAPRRILVQALTVLVILSPCVLVTILLAFFVAIRYISYRERAALAQHGIFLPEESFWDRVGQRSPRGVLWAGVITAMCGLALLLGLLLLGPGVWLLGGLLPLFVGLGMVFIYFVGAGSHDRAKKEPPPAEEQVGTEQDG